MKISHSVLAGVVLAAATFTAQAADLGYKKPSPALPVMTYSWTGFYLGLDAGYSIGRANHNVTGAAGASTTAEPSGFSLGGHAGYRYQMANNIVLGAEARAFANFDTGSRKRIGIFGNDAIVENKWGGDARLTLGYAMGRLLPYIAGGLAFADVKGCTSAALGGPCVANTNYSDTRVGWTIGAGLAYAVTNNLIARVDYAYSNFGAKNYTTTALVGGVTRAKLETHAVRAGLSWKF